MLSRGAKTQSSGVMEIDLEKMRRYCVEGNRYRKAWSWLDGRGRLEKTTAELL